MTYNNSPSSKAKYKVKYQRDTHTHTHTQREENNNQVQAGKINQESDILSIVPKQSHLFNNDRKQGKR